MARAVALVEENRSAEARTLIETGMGERLMDSLKLALEQLGLGPCYHMLEVRAAPERLEHWNRIAAGEVARLLDVPQNTMSTHLAILERAGLISSERHSRSIIYRAEVDRIRQIASFLVNDCCGGRPELCEPLIAEFTPCCTPKESTNVS